MSEFTVKWEIQVEADDLVGAAREALRIQRDPQSDAVVFQVESCATNADRCMIDLLDYGIQSEEEE